MLIVCPFDGASSLKGDERAFRAEIWTLSVENEVDTSGRRHRDVTRLKYDSSLHIARRTIPDVTPSMPTANPPLGRIESDHLATVSAMQRVRAGVARQGHDVAVNAWHAYSVQVTGNRTGEQQQFTQQLNRGASSLTTREQLSSFYFCSVALFSFEVSESNWLRRRAWNSCCSFISYDTHCHPGTIRIQQLLNQDL